ncbi:DNA-nicking endonuclease, Smr domain [Paracoccus laeviglucosivorans]|uniref:DNA-nicking endonuclease, Smr domain n=2 Tax=Paracoccus laeviglucosivorans TaxID=1197861 RepID=A0A521DKE7_9RHOB|nr:DNA-nicking endonuclease, Smr domain [Paracoccus laeviglucosivorans]
MPLQEPKPAPAPRAPDPVAPLPDFRIGAKSLKTTSRIDLSPHPGQSLRDAPVRMDHKTHRRMSQGKLIPEARLDLHGMTLNIAQPVLVRFVLNAQAQGFRLVLVITGKGKAGDEFAPLPVRPGALRHNVPHWLHMPPLDRLVLQVRPAHRRHGGEGAYYIYLRK